MCLNVAYKNVVKRLKDKEGRKTRQPVTYIGNLGLTSQGEQGIQSAYECSTKTDANLARYIGAPTSPI